MEELGFKAGDLVELRGLSKLELNGQRGTVLPLEVPEQAKVLGRLAVMLDSGKRLSLKVENLCKVPRAPPLRTGGDLGEEWSALLKDRGKSMAFPLRCPPAAKKAPEAAAHELVVLGINLRHASCSPVGGERGRAALAELTSRAGTPDVICVQEGLEGFDLLSQVGYARVMSSAVKAQPLREALYGEAPPAAAAEQLLVNELYLRAGGGEWEVVETGVEQLSSDLTFSSGDGGAAGQLATRSAVWSRLLPRASPEGPSALVLGAQLSGGTIEERLFGGRLAGERARQVQQLQGLFEGRAGEADLGILFGVPAGASTASASRGQEGMLDSNPCSALAERGWVLLGGQDAPECGGSMGLAGALVDGMAVSRDVPVETELIPLSGLWEGLPASCHAIRASVTLRRSSAVVEERAHRMGLIELPAIGFGTCFMPEDVKARAADKEFRRLVEELTEEAVRAALAAGVRLFDSSNKHMNQQVVGRTLAQAMEEGLVTRSELFVVGRVSKCKDRAEVRREVDMLLRELRLEYVDLLVLDVPPERAPGAWPWAEEVYREGRARFLGAANFDLLGPKVCAEVFRDFLADLVVPPVVHAMEVHPLNSNEEMSECCRGLEVRVMAHSPLGAPHKIEAFMKVLTKSDARDMRPVLKVPENRLLREVGQRHGVSAAQVALRWNLQRGHCVVPKSFDPAHIVENTELFHFSLSPREMSILAGLHKGVRAERFFQQAYCQGHKALPRMTRDGQDACEAILSKLRGPSVGGGQEEQMQAELAELYRRQEAIKGKGKGGPLMLKGMGKDGLPALQSGKGGPHFQQGVLGAGGPAMLGEGGATRGLPA